MMCDKCANDTDVHISFFLSRRTTPNPRIFNHLDVGDKNSAREAVHFQMNSEIIVVVGR